MDEERYAYITDRMKHIIISGGENISPKEVEAVINQLPGVAESAVVGIRDSLWGEKVVAAVVAQADGDVAATDVKAYCRVHLHDWKCPKEVHILKTLPKNAMGKVLKEKLQTLLTADA